MLLFVQQNEIHQYPVPERCSAVYREEQLRDTIPHGVKQCRYCLGSWPGSREDELLQKRFQHD